MAGNAVFQLQKGLQQVPLGAAVELHVSAGLAAADHGTEGDDQDVVQGMEAGIDRPRVFQISKYIGQLVHGVLPSATVWITS